MLERQQIKIPIKETRTVAVSLKIQQHLQLLTDIVTVLRKDLQFSVISIFGTSDKEDDHK